MKKKIYFFASLLILFAHFSINSSINFGGYKKAIDTYTYKVQSQEKANFIADVTAAVVAAVHSNMTDAVTINYGQSNHDELAIINVNKNNNDFSEFDLK